MMAKPMGTLELHYPIALTMLIAHVGFGIWFQFSFLYLGGIFNNTIIISLALANSYSARLVGHLPSRIQWALVK